MLSLIFLKRYHCLKILQVLGIGHCNFHWPEMAEPQSLLVSSPLWLRLQTAHSSLIFSSKTHLAVLCIFLSSYLSPLLLCRQLLAVSFQNNKVLLSSFPLHRFLSIAIAITLILISSQLQQPPYLHPLPLFSAAYASHQIHANQPIPHFAYEAPRCLQGKKFKVLKLLSAKNTHWWSTVYKALL